MHEKGTLGKQRLLITMPPRHIKCFSLLCIFRSIIYHVNRIITYSLPRTIRTWRETFGRQVRDLAREPFVSQAFPDFAMSEESRAVNGVLQCLVRIMLRALVVLLRVGLRLYLFLMIQLKST